jgi:hypothetical protein
VVVMGALLVAVVGAVVVDAGATVVEGPVVVGTPAVVWVLGTYFADEPRCVGAGADDGLVLQEVSAIPSAAIRTIPKT